MVTSLKRGVEYEHARNALNESDDFYPHLQVILASATRVSARCERAKTSAQPAASTFNAPSSFAQNDRTWPPNLPPPIPPVLTIAFSLFQGTLSYLVHQATLLSMAPTKATATRTLVQGSALALAWS